MTRRTRSESVTFRRPFILTGIDGVQPPGRYTVETDEELLPTMTSTAYRRLVTWFRLPALPPDARPASGSTQAVPVDPIELSAALARDATPGWEVAVAGRLEDLMDDAVMCDVLKSAGLTPSEFKTQLRDLAHRIERTEHLKPHGDSLSADIGAES